MLTSTPADYRRHADVFGSELVIETAAHDLDEHELRELRAYVRHLERTKRWHHGRWHERPTTGRACEECGLDLPHGARSDMKRHAHCRVRASRRPNTRGTALSVTPRALAATSASDLEQS